MITPTTPEGLAQYDHLPPLSAIMAAWTRPGRRPDWHARAQQAARAAMPHVTDHLDAGNAQRAVTRWMDSTFMPNLTGRQRDNLREAMPVLVRALSRAVAERREEAS